MVAGKSISRIFSVLFVAVFLLTGVLPVQAGALASPLYANGDLLWAKGMGGAGYDVGKNIAVDSNHNVYTIGFFSGIVDFDPGAGTFNLTSRGSDDIFISKLDSNGALVWAKSVGGTGYDEGKNIVVDLNGNIYTTGLFSGTVDFDPGPGTFNMTSTGFYGGDIFVSKLDSNGDFVWANSMGGVNGGADVYSIVVDSSSNVLITGYFIGTVDFDPDMVGTYNVTSAGVYDIFISKLDSNGDFVWARSMGGTNNDMSRGITVDSNNNIYTTGDFQDTADFDPGVGNFNLISAGGSDIFVSKLDSNGEFVWAKSMGGGAGFDVGRDIAVDLIGNVYTTGDFYGAADFDSGVGTFSLISAGSSDIFVSKLDGNGDFVWAKSMSGMDDGEGSGIALDSSNNIYVTGSFKATVDFDPGAGTFNLTSAGLWDIFVSKLDGNGDFIWAKSIGGTDSDGIYGVAVDSIGDVYTTGYFISTVDFDPGVGTFNLISAGGSDIFIFKLRVDTPTVISIVRAGVNPTSLSSVDFTVTFSEPVTGVGTNDFSLMIAGAGVSDAAVSGVSGTGSYYTVTVNTGTGNGTIRLDVVDDNSIINAALNPLGGVEVGDGDFTGGEIYHTDKTAPIVVSIMRVNPSLTNLASVDFTVTFSEPVTGVDNNDFTLTKTGSVSNVGVSGVSGTGSVYTVTVNTGNDNGTIRLNVTDNNSILDVALNPLGGAVVGDGDFVTGEIYTIIKSATFIDVPLDYSVNSYIERLYNAGITGGCSLIPLMYCPENTVTRAQMAVFLLRGIHGSSYVPPAVGDSTGFADVPTDHPVAAWIKQLAAEGITGGCSNGNYCPDATVTRAQMAVFLLRSKYTSAYTPPPANGDFTDVPLDHLMAAWIEQLAAEGITGGCREGTYCPDGNVTRAQMAVFLVRTFNLP